MRSCQRSQASGAPNLAPSFWDTSDQLRDALAEWHIGRVLAAYRTHPAHGFTLSQTVVAGWLGITQAQLSRIETGPAVMDLARLTRWAQALRIPEHLLWFKLPRAADEPAVEPHESGLTSSVSWSHDEPEADTLADLHRRLFLQGVAVAALPVLGVDELSHITGALGDARRYADRELLGHFRKQFRACTELDGRDGPRVALRPVLGLVAAIESTAREAKPGLRPAFLTEVARIAEFAGWLYRDAGRPELASYWRDRAMEWAQEAGNAPLQGYVLLRKAQAASDARDGAKMLSLARAVQRGPWSLPDSLRAEAAQQEARGVALTTGDRTAVERKLDEAHALATSGSGARADSLLALQTALCVAAVGQTERALALYDEHLTPAAFSYRDLGHWRARHAGALAAAGDPDRAAVVGLRAHEVARTVQSVRTLREVQRVLRQLGSWSRRPAVRELSAAVQS